MRKLISIIVLSLTVLVGGAGVANAADLLPCQYEDSNNCYWDASERGNGAGQDFVTVDGVTTYADPESASDALAAWQAFDVSGAAALLPADGAQVDYAGAYDGHALSWSEIAVWDVYGNAYLFTLS